MSLNDKSFFELLDLIRGDRSIAAFSADSGIAISTIYKYLSGDFKYPLTKNAAEKLASASSFTEEIIGADLLINKSRELIVGSQNSHGMRARKKQERIVEEVRKIVQDHLLQEGVGIEKYNQKDTGKSYFDFALKIKKDGKEAILYYDVKTAHRLDMGISAIYRSVGRILSQRIEKNEQYNIIIVADAVENIDSYFTGNIDLPIKIIVICNNSIVKTISFSS